MARKFTQGVYKPINPEKYKGDVNRIIYRSSWELSYLFKLDTDPNVIEFSSEETVIKYQDATGKIRRYFVDFKVKRKTPNGIITELIEIKPYKETIPPVLNESRKRTKTKIYEATTWDINQRKWAQARKYCEIKGWHFRIITEYDLGIKGW